MSYGVRICSFVDAESQSADGKWRWEFRHFLGPTFVKKNGEPLKTQPAGHSSAWHHFYRWLDEHKKTCKRCQPEVKS